MLCVYHLDELLEPVLNVDVSLLIVVSDVPGVEPATPDGGSGLSLVVQVAQHHLQEGGQWTVELQTTLRKAGLLWPVKIGQNWLKLVEIGRNWSKLKRLILIDYFDEKRSL